jgi:lipopolysaccharide/colanic/teichoic acid biosynthesis glycosyltransferase
VRLKLGSPVLFRQQRPGLGGKPFMLIKFRSITGKRDAQGNLLPDAERLTQFGKFLRASSLDELPELWNVLKGEMSLVGPRPRQSHPLARFENYLPHPAENRQTGRHQPARRGDDETF